MVNPFSPTNSANSSPLLILPKTGNYEAARQQFTEANTIVGGRAQLVYNIALCHYRLKQYVPALKFLAEIIERGIKTHPELNVGMTTEGIEVKSVGNTKV